MKKTIIIILIAFLLISCANPIFFNEIKSLNSKMGVKSSDERKVFKEIQKKIPNSKHIIYYNQPSFNIDSEYFTGLVYDFESEQYFYLEYKDSKLDISITPNNSYAEYQKENIDLFINGRYDEINKKSKNCLYSGNNIYDYLYEINLESGNNINKNFINFFLCTDFADNK
ncbi:hypothetical protein [Flavobacterium sp. HNIBRBA15423]|uniref:hypothetical protein n=1 Tax=Flavobacterium sp. HNIBRBA15423 TaxID=3458683 RepID=UPI0040450F8C